MYSSSITFEEAYNSNKDINILLTILRPTIKNIINSSYRRNDISIGKEDIEQEVLIHIWELLTKTDYLEGMDGHDAFKYIYTAIKMWVIRTINRTLRKEKKRRHMGKGFYAQELTLSAFDLEYFDIRAEIPLEILINTVRDICHDVRDFDKVFNYLCGEGEDDTLIRGGLSPFRYYKIVHEIKHKIKGISYE